MSEAMATAAEMKLIDWATKVVEAQGEIIRLQQAISDKDMEIRNLREKVWQFQQLGDLTYNEGCYWEKKEDGWEGPFCPYCKDGNGKKVRMDFPQSYYSKGAVSQPQCPFCHTWGQVANPKPPT